jgi:flagellar hook-length control protein FliK
MALEIAPAKATPAKSSAQAASGRADSVDRGAKPAGHGKNGQATDPAGFLALLMGMGTEPAPGASADPAALTFDAIDPDAKDVDAELVVVLPVAEVTAPLPEAIALLGNALPDLHRFQDPAEAKAGESADSLTLDIADKGSAGTRRRASPMTDTPGPMGTQKLQTETPKETSVKVAELMAAREGEAAISASQLEVPPVSIPASLQVPIASEDARKSTHLGQAKLEVAGNLVVLSSGLSGAVSTGGITDTGLYGSAAQFQSVVAQEVAYYVSQDVQSAEMKLEGVGGGPVEVSINVQGKEAQVVFRTDELQTREMLEGATAQLTDMLQQQGVVLTGVFVGSSGAGDAGQQQERRFRQGTRSEATLRIATPEMRGTGVSLDGVGRTLDLYV